MLDRRTLLATSGAALLMPGLAQARAKLGDDGLYHQPWFLNSFLDLKEDLAEAKNNGKRLAIFYELRGCPYCRETHFKNFDRSDISSYVQANFEILQLNLLGSRMVTDFDGEELTEKALAKKYGVRFSPTIIFLKDDGDEMAKLAARKRDVARAKGYLRPEHFLSMFEFVASKSYETMSFRKYLKSKKSS